MKSHDNWLNIIQDYLLPPTCVLCGSAGFAGRDLCYGCYAQLPQNSPCCQRCAAHLYDFNETNSLLCANCLKFPPAFDAVFAPFLYKDALRSLILDLKFQADYKNARLLGQLLAQHAKQLAPMPDCLLPVPLHKNRYQSRGFNQSIEIARTVAKQLQLPLDLSSCIRHRDTLQQANLTAKQRHKNISNAFSVLPSIQVKHIALLDDVMTTGSTVRELAMVLKASGVQRVDVWLCARA